MGSGRRCGPPPCWPCACGRSAGRTTRVLRRPALRRPVVPIRRAVGVRAIPVAATPVTGRGGVAASGKLTGMGQTSDHDPFPARFVTRRQALAATAGAGLAGNAGRAGD